jgi:hypothetical protein
MIAKTSPSIKAKRIASSPCFPGEQVLANGTAERHSQLSLKTFVVAHPFVHPAQKS